VALASVLLTGLGTSLLAARPAQAETVWPELRSRDVVLCLDVSGSMFPVDAAVLNRFKQIVGGFDGERVAMSWFNSSSVTLFPLTDDYQFIDGVLDPMRRQFEAVASAMTQGDYWNVPDDLSPDMSGTELGEGSSLPGDGLASCLDLFDQRETERPRSVIFATDNMLEGSPLLTLTQAAELARQMGVKVYALCPEDYYSSWSGGVPDDWTMEAFADLRRQAELTGGGYYAAGDSTSVERILDSVMEQQAAQTPGQPRRIIHDKPLVGVIMLVTGLFGVLIGGGWQGRPVWRVVSRRAGLVLLTGLIIWNPAVGQEDLAERAVDADVWVLVDTSPSVAAEDWDGDRPRLDGVQNDLAEIASHHAGARLSIITFNTETHLILPLTSDAGAVVAAATTLRPIPEIYATGSSIDSALPVLSQAMERSAAQRPERARLVYYLGDGEQTSASPVGSFGGLASLVDGGAVLGYGTEAGGPMRGHVTALANEMGLVGGWDEEGYITAPDGSVAVSRIDQVALERIASELGVDYSQRSAQEDVWSALWHGALPERTTNRTDEVDRPVAAWLAALMAPLVVWETIILVGRWRKATGLAKLIGRPEGGAVRLAGTGGTGGTAGPGGTGVPGRTGRWLGGRAGSWAGRLSGRRAGGGSNDGPGGWFGRGAGAGS
jgi:hypothetical protein